MRSLKLLAFLIIFGCAALEESRLESRPKSENVVFLIDKSGSMRDEKRLSIAQEGVATFIEQHLSAPAQFAVIAFDHAPFILIPFGETSRERKELVAKRIPLIFPAGKSAPAAAILEASRRLPAGGRIILISDGKLSEPEAIRFVVETIRKKSISLSSIALSRGSESSNLENLAKEGKGEFGIAVTAEELVALLSRMFGRSR